MIKIDIFLLDKSNNLKEGIKLIKSETYQEFILQLKQKLKNIPQYYELFILGNNNNEIKINNEENYKKIEDILFFREIDDDILEKSLYEINYLSLSKRY